MDYDDNQHAPCNTQLGSEDNNKFPPGLRSYSLPKFDLDEHFQDPVAFDSLGERGILLDLPSQTGDHWIDDYSREDSSILILDPVSQSIEFGSAEESCTIPRKCNVWSEAASSESVEMLLNSVGQDEMDTKKGDAAKSDVCETRIVLTKQMDTGSCEDDSAFKTSNVSCADPRVSPDNFLINSSSLEKHDWKDVCSVEGVSVNVIGDHHEHQGHENLTMNELHEKEGSSPNSSLKQCSSFVESFQHSTTDFLLDSKRCCDDDVHMKCVGSQQVEGSLLGECPLHVECVKKDAVCCTPAISNKEASERLVSMPTVSPSMQADGSEKLQDTEKATYHIREVSEDALCQRPQDTVIADDGNDNTKQFPSIQAEIVNHPMEDEFVDRKSDQVAETDYVEQSNIIAGSLSLVQKVSASPNATESKHELVSIDLSCRKVHTANAEEVILDLDSKLPKEVADARAGNKVAPAIVNDFSELLTGQSPGLSKPMAHRSIGLHSLISLSENASQQPSGTKPRENDSGSSGIDMPKADFASDLGLKVASSRHGLAMKNTGQSPSRIAAEDTGKLEMVVGDICTSESLLSEAKCLSTACINQDVSQIRSKEGVISMCASSCSEGTLHQATERNVASNKAHVQQKEKKSDLPGSGETGNQGRVSSNSLDMPVDGECQLASKDDPASVSGKHASLSVGAVTDLVIHSPAPSQYSTDNAQHSKLGTSEAEKATHQNSPEKDSSDSFPSLVEQTGSSAVFEVSLKNSQFSEVSVAVKQSGEDEQLKHPMVSSATSISNACGIKGLTSEASIPFSEENRCQNCSPSIDTQSCSTAQADAVTLLNSSESGLKEACLDGRESNPAPNSVGALNSVNGSSCKPEILKSDTDASKVDNDGNVAADCGSPTIISCKESLQDEAHHHETENQSLLQSPASGNAPGATSSTTGQSDGMKASDQIPDMCDTPESDKSFTFKIGNLSGSSVNEKSGKDWKQFPSTGPAELFQTTGSAERTSDGNPQISEEKKMIEASKSRGKSKSRSRSGNGTERATTSKGKPKKEASSRKLTSLTAGNDKHEGNASAGPSKNVLGSPTQLEESKKLAHVEGSTTKPYSITSIQASTPVLNALASSALALFQQPFTDMQQLQLRAQIFVYGYLIRGAAPDEACMVSAFGEAGRDGGRNMWENVWRVAVERAHSQKSLPASPEISPIIHSGMRVTEQGSKGNSGSSKSSVVSASRNTNKSSPLALLNPAVSLPSPMWNATWNATPSSRDMVQSSSIARASLIDPHPTFSPYLYSSPQIRPFTGHFSSWPSQVSSPVPWILSHTSTLDAGSQYAAFSMPDTVQVAPVRDHAAVSLVNVTPSTQVVTSTPLPSLVSSTVAAANVSVDVKKTTSASLKQPSADQKPRKRRKSVPTEDNQLLNVQQPQTGSVSSEMVTTHVSAPLSLTAATTLSVSAGSMCKASSGAPVSLSPPTALPTSNYHISDHNTEQRAAFSEEASIQVEQAKLRAEDAAAHAASAARHSQELWNQLTMQKNSKRAIDVEGRLASALAAAAAAASVAKAAAAAAKVASDAALQAKLVADEALTKKRMVTGGGISEVGKNSANVTPVSLSKGKVKQGGTSSVVEFAKEAARKGVEAASAATKRAQNLDAVVKAAGLAAEAISQATAIVAMGDPLPLTLNQLLEAGPEGYWKHQDVEGRFALEPTVKEVKNSGEANSLNVKVSSKNDAVRGVKETNTNISEELPGGPTEGGRRLLSSIRQEVAPVEIASKRRQRARKAAGSANAQQTIPSSEFESHNDSSKGNCIQQGSLVEVISDEDGLRAVWFSAKVLEVKEGKAYVCYNDLLSDEGTGQLQEWIPLEAAHGKPPRIRTAHPTTAMQFEGTRKRRRAAMGNHNWSVGDHVDAWMRDGWWEGVIMEKNKEDQTKLTVHFPDEGDISTVRTWNIRPSLVWKDGQWVEWSRETACWPNEDDAPLDKRRKLDKEPENDGQNERNEDHLSKITKCDDTIKHQDSTSFALSSSVFSVGKSTTEDRDLIAGRVKRTGLQKGGSRVVFGVPKPKRKFMDVSKHYITEQVGKVGETNNPVKVANYLMPRGSSRLRNVSKDVPRTGRVTNTKSKDIKSGKLQGIQRKNRSKDDSSISALPQSVGATDDQPNVQPSASNENNSERQNRREIGFSDAAGGQESDEISSRSKPSSVGLRQAPKRKLASAGQGLSDEALAATGSQGKAALEPRRSNRRIQPTSRLLEGLQSSLITTKVASVGLHDKGGKSSKRSASSAKAMALRDRTIEEA
ncbi:uncharacterized protein LOC116252537 isoform X2 [Nymphaea colorata]|uniref:uncharacterized protein LOC116252537 isoform X2 n=1 Tax=Nymphaea colorata TaxID=210225 RepID=UPI00129E723F|nr:uncharacterized protein LOC116252537 isoform X2 [Nymphaea colorata]